MLEYAARFRAETQLLLRFGALCHLAGARALRHKPHCRTPKRIARQVGRARAPPDLHREFPVIVLHAGPIKSLCTDHKLKDFPEILLRPSLQFTL